MRLDHLLSKERNDALLSTLLSGFEGSNASVFARSAFGAEKKKQQNTVLRGFPVTMRLWVTPVPIPNTKVKT